MKLPAVLILFATVAECSPQFGGSGGVNVLALASKKEVKPKYRETAKRMVYSYGPIALSGLDEKKPAGGMSMDRKGQAGIVTLNSAKSGLCTSCTVLSARAYFRNEDGSQAKPSNGIYIHHFLSYDTSKAPKIPISADGLPSPPWAAFIDRGEDSGDTDTVFTTADGKFNSGFHFKDPKISMQYDVVNYNKQKKNVFLDLEIEFVNGLQGKDAGHVLKSVQGSPKVSKSGPAVTNSRKMTVTEDATIVWARGHIHAGGTEAVLMVNGKDVCTSTPTYDKEGVITKMSLCPKSIPLKKGDTVSLRGTYDLTKHELRKSTDGSTGGSKGSFGLGADTMVMFALSYAVGS